MIQLGLNYHLLYCRIGTPLDPLQTIKEILHKHLNGTAQPPRHPLNLPAHQRQPVAGPEL